MYNVFTCLLSFTKLSFCCGVLPLYTGYIDKIKLVYIEVSQICFSLWLQNDINSISGQVARSDARPPGMRTVAGSILGFDPRVWQHYFVDNSDEIISTAILSLPLINCRAVVCNWRKDVPLVLVNRLESLPRNRVVRLTDRLDMNIVVDWDVK